MGMDGGSPGSFQSVKDSLVTAPIVVYPDPSKEYILDTDVSCFGVGAVLSQEEQGQHKVLSYYSKSLNPAEQNYCVTRKELQQTVNSIVMRIG